MAYNILIVDDSSIVRKVLIKTFGMTEIKINQFYQAANGQEGYDTLQQNWIDLVFLDINMPVMNGMEFMRKIRQDEKLHDTPVVIVSTEGSKERIDELHALGIKAFLHKPVTPEGLVSTINSILGAQVNE